MKKIMTTGLALVCASFLCSCTLFLSSCATAGNNFEEQNLSMLKIGKTSYNDVCKILKAQPYTKSYVNGGIHATWFYVSAFGSSFIENKSIMMSFDENDILNKVFWVKDIELSPAERRQLGL